MNESGWVSCEMSSLVSPRKSSGPDRKVSGDFWYKTDSEYLHHLLQSQATNQQLPLVRRKEGLAALLVAIYFFKIMQLHSPVFSIENMQRLCGLPGSSVPQRAEVYQGERRPSSAWPARWGPQGCGRRSPPPPSCRSSHSSPPPRPGLGLSRSPDERNSFKFLKTHAVRAWRRAGSS